VLNYSKRSRCRWAVKRLSLSCKLVFFETLSKVCHKDNLTRKRYQDYLVHKMTQNCAKIRLQLYEEDFKLVEISFSVLCIYEVSTNQDREMIILANECKARCSTLCFVCWNSAESSCSLPRLAVIGQSETRSTLICWNLVCKIGQESWQGGLHVC